MEESPWKSSPSNALPLDCRPTRRRNGSGPMVTRSPTSTMTRRTRKNTPSKSRRRPYSPGRLWDVGFAGRGIENAIRISTLVTCAGVAESSVGWRVGGEWSCSARRLTRSVGVETGVVGTRRKGRGIRGREAGGRGRRLWTAAGSVVEAACSPRLGDGGRESDAAFQAGSRRGRPRQSEERGSAVFHRVGR